MSLRSCVCLLTLLAAAVPAFAQKQMTLMATLTSPTGDPVATVEAAAVDVTENGVKAKVVSVEPVDRVSKFHLLVDNGVGIPAEAIADLRTGLRGLVQSVPAGVEISIVTTAPQPRFIERGTTDKAKALKAVDLIVPDVGAGRFVESIFELGERIERDKNSANTVVVIGTQSGDLRVRDGDLKRIQERTAGGRTRYNVVLFMGRTGGSLGGDIQLELGNVLAKMSGGRFEQVNATSRLATILPEIGQGLAATMGATAKQFRIVVERPAGGAIGRVSLSVAGFLVSTVTMESSR